MMTTETVDTRGMNCPQPLVETRKQLRKMQPGQTLEIIGDHEVSKTEIPMALAETGDAVLETISNQDGTWKIVAKKGE